MTQINPTPTVPTPALKVAPSAPVKISATEPQTSASSPVTPSASDALQRAPVAQGAVPAEAVKISGRPAGAAPAAENPWKITSVRPKAGYIVNQQVLHTGTMQIRNPQFGTDVAISGIHQAARYNWSNINPLSGDRFAPDEPQNVLGVELEFANKFGLELEAKHNKIIVDDYNQTVHFQGTINGQSVDHDAPLNTFMQQHEQTYGNEQVSCLATRSFDLPAPRNHRLAYTVKAGPSLIITTTRTSVLNGNQFDQTTSGFGVAGWGATVENALRYELGPKMGRMGVEVAYGLSYLDYSHYDVVGGGTGSHDAVNGQLTVKLTKSFDLKHK